MISEQGPGRPLHADETPTEIMQAIGLEQPSLPQPSLPPRLPEIPTRHRERRQLKLFAGLAVLILAVLGVAGYEVASGVGHKSHPSAAPTPSHHVVVHSSAPVSASPLGTPSLPASPSPSLSQSPSPSSVAVVAQALKPASAAAVGPGGVAGDDPSTADLTIDASTSTAWQTQWYATPEFGGLKTGTGLLVDMGRTEKITSVLVTLGPESGADLQLRVGDSSSESALKKVAAQAGAGGTVRLKLASPALARYVLIWFTKLPPNGAGTYQVKVYNVRVYGER